MYLVRHILCLLSCRCVCVYLVTHILCSSCCRCAPAMILLAEEECETILEVKMMLLSNLLDICSVFYEFFVTDQT